MGVGSIIKVMVTGITDYGFFTVSDDGYSGLVHISQISNDFVSDIYSFVSESDYIYALVIGIDYEKKQMKLSIKDINYKLDCDNLGLMETRRGFLPLKEKLPEWINEKMQEYKIL